MCVNLFVCQLVTDHLRGVLRWTEDGREHPLCVYWGVVRVPTADQIFIEFHLDGYKASPSVLLCSQLRKRHKRPYTLKSTATTHQLEFGAKVEAFDLQS